MKKLLSAAVAAVLSLTAVCSVQAVTFTTKTITELEAERSELEKKTNEARQELEKVQDERTSVENEISNIDALTSSLQAETEKAESDLVTLRQRLEASEQDLSIAVEKRDRELEVFGHRVRYIHETGPLGYLNVVFSSRNYSDFLVRMQYITDIMEYDRAILDNLRSNAAIIEKKTSDIKAETDETEKLIALNEKKSAELAEAMEEKSRLMAEYSQSEEKYQQLVDSNIQASEQASSLIRAAQANGSNSITVYSGGLLSWPVPSRAPASSSLSSGFVSRARPIGSGYEFHTGYDIPAAYGADIVAAESGTVIAASWRGGYGNCVIIDHGAGISTLYGHNSQLVVSVGQRVERGQVIAKCGSTGNSTGNHCHFEVRENGAYVSPEPYLGVRNISS